MSCRIEKQLIMRRDRLGRLFTAGSGGRNSELMHSSDNDEPFHAFWCHRS